MAKADAIDWSTASDPLPRYNCFGFALGRTEWWEPPVYLYGIRANDETVWPLQSESVAIDAYVAAAETEGFAIAEDGAWEEGMETIMLYFRKDDREFRHAAKQVSPSVWASKMGTGSDVTHARDGVDSIQYGSGRIYLKRTRRNS